MRLEILTAETSYVACGITEEAAKGFLDEWSYGTSYALQVPEGEPGVDARVARRSIVLAMSVPDLPESTEPEPES